MAKAKKQSKLIPDKEVLKRMAYLNSLIQVEKYRHKEAMQQLEEEITEVQSVCAHIHVHYCYAQDSPSYDLCLTCGAMLEYSRIQSL